MLSGFALIVPPTHAQSVEVFGKTGAICSRRQVSGFASIVGAGVVPGREISETHNVTTSDNQFNNTTRH